MNKIFASLSFLIIKYIIFKIISFFSQNYRMETCVSLPGSYCCINRKGRPNNTYRTPMATQKMCMFKPQVHRPHLVGIFFLPNKPCIPSRSWPSFSVRPWPQPQKKYRKNTRVGYVPSNIKAVAVAVAEASGTEISTSVKATAGVTMKSPNLLGGSLLLELVSAELDPRKYFII